MTSARLAPTISRISRHRPLSKLQMWSDGSVHGFLRLKRCRVSYPANYHVLDILRGRSHESDEEGHNCDIHILDRQFPRRSVVVGFYHHRKGSEIYSPEPTAIPTLSAACGPWRFCLGLTERNQARDPRLLNDSAEVHHPAIADDDQSDGHGLPAERHSLRVPPPRCRVRSRICARS